MTLIRSTSTGETNRRLHHAKDLDTPSEPAPHVHIPALDAIRGIAILLVMVYHFNIGPEDPSAVGKFVSRLFHLGGCGVDLFFVLSGFLITGILFDSKERPHFFRNFFIRRSLRIFPLYYGVLLLIFVVMPALGLPTGFFFREAQQHQSWLWLYATNLFQAWQGSYLLGSFNHFWSLAVEEHFYLVWPFIIYACNRKQGILACLACILFGFACRMALMLRGDHEVAAYVLTPCRMDVLATGALLALAARGPKGLSGLSRWAKPSVLVSGLVLVGVFAWKHDVEKMDGTLLVIRFSLFAWFFGSVLLLALTPSHGGLAARFWNSGFLRLFGKYSYGLYVFHYPLIPVFQRIFPTSELALWSGSAFAGRLLFIALSIGASLVLAVVSWHAYEKHFVRLKDVLTRPKRSEWTAFAAPA